MYEETFVRLARRWGPVVILATLLGAATAYVFTGFMTPTYRATSTLLVEQQQQPGLVLPADLETSERLAALYARLITTQPVLERAAALGVLDLTPGEIGRSLEVQQVDSVLISVTASSSEPEQTQLIANTVSNAFIAMVGEGALTTGPVNVKFVEAAGVPGSPASPQRQLNAAGGALLGFVGSALLIVLFVRMNDQVKFPRQVWDVAGLPTLGEVRRFPAVRDASEQLQAALRPNSGLAEDVRAVRTNLAAAMEPQEHGGFEHPVVLFTGAVPESGTSVAVANVAVAFGLAGYRTLLIDGDLRDPSLHAMFGLDNQKGLSTLLLHDGFALEVVRETSHPGVSVLPSGHAVTNAADVLGSAEMRALLVGFREQYDVILIDTPPALEVTDAAALAAMSDLSVVVARSGKMRIHDLRETVEDLARSGCEIAGVVFNHSAHGSKSAQAAAGRDRTRRRAPLWAVEPAISAARPGLRPLRVRGAEEGGARADGQGGLTS